MPEPLASLNPHAVKLRRAGDRDGLRAGSAPDGSPWPDHQVRRFQCAASCPGQLKSIASACDSYFRSGHGTGLHAGTAQTNESVGLVGGSRLEPQIDRERPGLIRMELELEKLSQAIEERSSLSVTRWPPQLGRT